MREGGDFACQVSLLGNPYCLMKCVLTVFECVFCFVILRRWLQEVEASCQWFSLISGFDAVYFSVITSCEKASH